MATVIQNLKNEIVMSTKMYKYRVENNPEDTESVEMWEHYINQIRTAIYVLWSTHVITTHGFETLTSFLSEQCRDAGLNPKTL